MSKGSGTTRGGSSSSPRGLSSGSGRVDLSEAYRGSGMLDMDSSKAPKITDSDFSEETRYDYLTKPMELDVDIAKAVDFWNRGLTGGESGHKLRETKRAIVDVIKRYSGEELTTSDVEYDKDLQEFVAWHRPKKPGEVAKSFWKVDKMTQTIRFGKSKRSGSITGRDKNGEDLYRPEATHNYTVKVKNTGTKEY